MSTPIQHYYSHGKLLLSGEYLVLKGAKALALPVNLGQSLQVGTSNNASLDWITFEKELPVFTARFSLTKLHVLESSDAAKGNYISTLLKAAKSLNPTFLSENKGLAAKATVAFDMSWGLGSSSTLINNIAQWASVDPFKLNALVSKGSGYDIACATQKKLLLYYLENNIPVFNTVDFSPPFLSQLNLVYLNNKMATEGSIGDFLNRKVHLHSIIEQVSDISLSMLKCNNLDDFMELLKVHETLISQSIDQDTVQKKHFADFQGQIKSLGAWGGDFALVASHLNYKEQKNYFSSLGYPTFFPLQQLMIN